MTDTLRAAAENVSDRRTLLDDGFWVSRKEMRALDLALGRPDIGTAALAASATDEGQTETYAQKRRPRSFAASGRATGESKRPWYRARPAAATDEGFLVEVGERPPWTRPAAAPALDEPHPFDGLVYGIADRPCTRCGKADRHPIHARPATAPALDVERLADVLARRFPGNDDFADAAEYVAREYARFERAVSATDEGHDWRDHSSSPQDASATDESIPKYPPPLECCGGLYAHRKDCEKA